MIHCGLETPVCDDKVGLRRLVGSRFARPIQPAQAGFVNIDGGFSHKFITGLD